jgi:hypothetical protein
MFNIDVELDCIYVPDELTFRLSESPEGNGRQRSYLAYLGNQYTTLTVDGYFMDGESHLELSFQVFCLKADGWYYGTMGILTIS